MVDRISVVILTKNSHKYLKKCLDALIEFKEIVILDNGSSDDTIEIAKSYPNTRITQHKFIGFGPLKNLAVKYASFDWILSIDSDEIVTPELIEAIGNLDLTDFRNIYAVSRKNYYNGRLVKCCGWYPDIVNRLFNRNYTSFSNSMVHESLVIHPDTKKCLLNGAVLHYPFDNVESLINKMQSYSSLYARENKKSLSPAKAFWHGFFAFFKNYIIQKGIFCGYEGLLISVSNANGVFYKYMKLYEKQVKGS